MENAKIKRFDQKARRRIEKAGNGREDVGDGKITKRTRGSVEDRIKKDKRAGGAAKIASGWNGRKIKIRRKRRIQSQCV